MNANLTTAEVATLLRTSPETVRYWRHIKYGPKSFKVGRRVLYAAEDVDSFIAATRAEGHQPAQIDPPHVRLGRPEPKRSEPAKAEGSLTCPHCGGGIDLTVTKGQA